MAEPEIATEPLTEPAEKDQKQLLEAGKLLYNLVTGKDTRKSTLKLIKEAVPTASIPEIELEHEVEERVSARTKPLEESNKSLADKVGALERAMQRRTFAEQHGLQDEELVEVEKYAADKGISKADTAVEFWRQTQLGTPRATRRDAGGDEYLEKLRKTSPRDGIKLRQLAAAEGQRVLKELRRRAG